MSRRYKTARCILYRDEQFLLAIHNSFWRASDRRWGLPGGQIERGEAPHVAALRELREELYVRIPEVMEIGAFSYKHHDHMVYAAPYRDEIRDWDNVELVDVDWFDIEQIANLKQERRLHAGYELEAVLALRRLIAADQTKARIATAITAR